MSCDLFEVGQKVECLANIPVKTSMGAPIDANAHEVVPGDIGEITITRKAGSLHWLVIKWDRLGRTFNLNADQFDMVKLAEI